MTTPRMVAAVSFSEKSTQRAMASARSPAEALSSRESEAILCKNPQLN